MMSTAIITCPGGYERKNSSLPSPRQAMPPRAFACDTWRATFGAARAIADALNGRTNV